MRPLPLLSPSLTAAASRPRAARLSITDRCDLACVYCRPHRHEGYARTRLDRATWRVVAEGLRRAGVERVRLTGGEPLLHADVIGIVSDLCAAGFRDVALTTNATRLARLARPLREAGLHRLNVSLDSLDPQRFFRLTRGGRLEDVLRGLDACVDAGFAETKLNTVVLAGENDDELEPIMDFAHARGCLPRFLEVMPVGEAAGVEVFSVAAMKRALAHRLRISEEARPDPGRGPARYLHLEGDERLRVGFISGTTEPFCAGCDRLRVTSDGSLRACLAKDDGTRLSGVTPEGVAAQVAAVWQGKPDGATFRGCSEASARKVVMRYLGG